MAEPTSVEEALDLAEYVAPRGLFRVAPLPHWGRIAAIPPGAKILLSCVLRHSDYRPHKCKSLGSCLGGGDTVAVETGLGARTVQRALRLLEEAGLLWIQRRGRRTTVAKARPPKGANLHKHDLLWIPEWLLRVPYLRPAQKLVYAAISQSATDLGRTHVSYRDIAYRAGVSRTTAIKAVCHLVEQVAMLRCSDMKHENRYEIRPLEDMKGSFRTDAVVCLATDRSDERYLRALTKQEVNESREQQP